MKPVNILWRMALGAVDGTVTTSCALAVAWSIGVLPTLEQLGVSGQGLASGAILMRSPQILALAFNEKAAAEMQERVDLLVPYGYADVTIRTFHSFGEEMLSSHGVRAACRSGSGGPPAPASARDARTALPHRTRRSPRSRRSTRRSRRRA